MDAVTMVSTDILQGFGSGESVASVSVDIEGAFNSVLPGVLFDQLRCLRLSSGIHNFISYITSQRELSFSADDPGARTFGVGVPRDSSLQSCLTSIRAV